MRFDPQRLKAMWKKDKAVGVATSLVLHASLAAMFLVANTNTLRGDAGKSDGVSGQGDGEWVVPVTLAFQRPLAEPVSAQASEPEQPPISEVSSEILSVSPQFVEHTSEERKTSPGQTEKVLAESGVQVGGAAPGRPDGSLSLLEQIARCLPNNVRPDLRPAMLTLDLDETGKLRAVPALEVNTDTLTRDQLRASNMVIQASLQCGPYLTGASNGSTIQLAADFSQIASDANP